MLKSLDADLSLKGRKLSICIEIASIPLRGDGYLLGVLGRSEMRA